MQTQETSTIKIGELELNGFVYIPPMAGFTDVPYRILCRKFDPDVLLSTEMLSSKALIYKDKFKTSYEPKKMDIPEGEELTGIQLFGHEPEVMAEAAEIATAAGAKFIDINMGCPVAKIVKGMDGAALMREPELALKIVKAVLKATHLPVTVKTRLGWCSESLNANNLARDFEQAGIKALTLHGRTRAQKYMGEADWQEIGRQIKGLKIPVFANGDIREIDDAIQAIEISGATGVAIARGTMGKPWFSKQINHYFKTGERLPEPDLIAKLELAAEHARLLVKYKGEKQGACEMRKHIVNYVHGMNGASKMRAKLAQLDSLESVLEAIEEIRSNL
jgi:tRNA-dihydrouridine synthase B